MNIDRSLRRAAVAVALAIALSGCNKATSTGVAVAPSPTAPPPSPAHAGAVAVKCDACRLITPEEFEALAGSPLKDAKNTERAAGGAITSQCFYTAAEYSKSVTVMVTQPDGTPAASDGPREVWRRTFGRFSTVMPEGDEEKTREGAGKRSEADEEKEKKPPLKVEGVGEEAFWLSGIGGTLYVLHGELFLRVSVGGPAADDVKLEKAKAIAAKALRRL